MAINEWSTDPGRTQSDYDDEYLYPPAKWTGGHAELLNDRNHWKIRAELAEARWHDIPWQALRTVLEAVEGKRNPGATHAVHVWLDTHGPQEVT